MVCDIRKEVEKILGTWDKSTLIQVIVDEMSCCELEQFLKENR